MTSISAPSHAFGRRATVLACIIGMGLGLSGPAQAINWESDSGDFRFSWDTTLSYGAAWRTDTRADNLVATVNGGTAYSANYDDGNLNFKRNLVSSTAKITSEIELEYKAFGGFFRGSTFQDFELTDEVRERTPVSDPAIKRDGKDGDLLDAFVWYRDEFFNIPFEIRVGEQVVNWGESTFIQNGNNVINHINVSAIRIPGAELREALLPQDLVWVSVAPTANTTLELVYQYDWDDTEPEGVGTFFGNNDFVSDGGGYVRLGFGDTPDEVDSGVFTAMVDPLNDGNSRPFNAIPRGMTEEPSDDGQYGVSLRYFAEDFNNGTDFGFYYYNYHSRLPLINARTGTLGGLLRAALIAGSLAPGGAADIAGAAGLAFATSGGDRNAALAAGRAAANPGINDFVVVGLVDTAITGGDVAAAAGAYVTDEFGATAEYFTSFPEDIQMVGASFNTTVGLWALQGEYSHHINKPFQIDDLEILFAGLSALRDPFAEFGQLGSFSFNPTGAQNNPNTPPGTRIFGYKRLDYSQFQATFTRVFGPHFGASQGAFVAEGAWSHVHRFPNANVLRFDAAGTFVSGNEDLAALGHPGKPVLPRDFFPTANSYGYRLLGLLEYNNVLGPVNLIPRFSFQHDVKGITPGPGGNFIEGRKALTLQVTATYQNRWEGSLSWTSFYGAGGQNLIHDRDFIGTNIKYTF